MKESRYLSFGLTWSIFVAGNKLVRDHVSNQDSKVNSLWVSWKEGTRIANISNASNRSTASAISNISIVSNMSSLLDEAHSKPDPEAAKEEERLQVEAERERKEMENSSIYKFEDKEYDESAIDEEGFQDFFPKNVSSDSDANGIVQGQKSGHYFTNHVVLEWWENNGLKTSLEELSKLP